MLNIRTINVVLSQIQTQTCFGDKYTKVTAILIFRYIKLLMSAMDAKADIVSCMLFWYSAEYMLAKVRFMAFVMEYGEHRLDISAVDYGRGWRLIGGGGGRDRVRHFELVDASNSDKHLSHCEFLTDYRELTEDEESQHVGIKDFHFYKIVGMGFVPGLDKKQSLAVYQEAIVARNEYIREKVRSGERKPFIEIFE